MPNISEGLELHAKTIKQELARIDINLKFPNKVIDAYDIFQKLSPIKDLENIFHKLRIITTEIHKRFYSKIQNCINQFLSHFNLQNEKIYQLIDQKQYLMNRKEDAEFEKELLLRKLLLESNESVKQRQEKVEEDIIEYEEKIQNIQSEINQLNQQNPQYDFSIKLDCQFATKALEFVENCESTGDDHIKILVAGPLNLLKKYIKEYGIDINNQITENFENAIKSDSSEQPLKNSYELDFKTSELLNLRNFPKVFDIIDGNNKINDWLRKFSTFYRDLHDHLQVAQSNQNFEDLLKYVNISKALTSLDNFVKENGQNFENLHNTFKGSLLSGTREIIRTILESISMFDFARANELLAQFNEKPINPKDLAQIKFDLQSALNKLMKDTISSVRALDETIEGSYSSGYINCINDNILNTDMALNKSELIEYLDPKAKAELENFRNKINEIFSKIVIKALKSIVNYMDSDCLKEAQKGLENIKKVISALYQCNLSEEANNLKDDVDRKRDQIAEKITERNFSDITSYAYHPPKDIINILRDLSLHSPGFRRAFAALIEKVRQAVQEAIREVRNLPYEQCGDKIRDIKFALK